MKALEFITPQKGIGPIEFGITREKALEILGQPTEIESVNDEDDMYNGEVWHYDELEISLSFDEDSDWQLFEMSVASPDISIGGKLKVGMDLASLKNQLNEMGWDDYDTDSMKVNNTEEIYVLELVSHNVLFWFEDGLVCEIQFSL